MYEEGAASTTAASTVQDLEGDRHFRCVAGSLSLPGAGDRSPQYSQSAQGQLNADGLEGPGEGEPRRLFRRVTGYCPAALRLPARVPPTKSHLALEPAEATLRWTSNSARGPQAHKRLLDARHGLAAEACRPEGKRYNSRMNSHGIHLARSLCVVVLLSAIVGVPGLAADLPQVLQPNETAYRADEVAVLLGALDALRSTLAAPTYASQRAFGLVGWGSWTSAQFAAYSAGVLSGGGYETRLVSAAGWPDGVHTWVLVAISVGERVAWVPVEAESKQLVLGTLAERTDAQGVLWFEEAYVGFTDVVEVPANRAPVARITTKDTSVSTTSWTMLTGSGSYDPDGSIVLYVWDFGDGEPPTSTTSKYISRLFTSGTFVVVLTVVDQRGAMATATIEIKASAGCGCG